MDRAELTEKVIQLQHRVTRNLGRYTNESWMGLNLTFAQIKSLLIIGGEKRINLKKLATALGVTPSNVTGIVERLVEQELVTRRGCDEDRRVLLLETTPKGESLVSGIMENRLSHMSQILAPLTIDELSRLLEAYTILLKAVDNYQEQTDRVAVK